MQLSDLGLSLADHAAAESTVPHRLVVARKLCGVPSDSRTLIDYQVPIGFHRLAGRLDY